jgi:hypothetical protein
MKDEVIQRIAVDAIDWAKGSWGQGKYDVPRYDNATMAAIYARIAKIAESESKFYAGLPADKHR